MTAPSVFPATVTALVVPSTASWQKVVTAVAQLPGSNGPTWVHLTATDSQGQIVTLALLQWQSGLQAPQIQPPISGAPVSFEVYNAAGSLAGSL
jgi:hypothetical protein